MYMSNITIRVPEELKKQMERFKDINWSEVARRAFEDTTRREERKRAAESIKKLRMESVADWNGVKEIRRWRDAAR